jgi:hypothetical protein
MVKDLQKPLLHTTLMRRESKSKSDHRETGQGSNDVRVTAV